MLSKNIRFTNFTKKKLNKNLKVLFKKLIDKNNYDDNVIKSFSKSYSYSFTKKQVKCNGPTYKNHYKLVQKKLNDLHIKR